MPAVVLVRGSGCAVGDRVAEENDSPLGLREDVDRRDPVDLGRRAGEVFGTVKYDVVRALPWRLICPVTSPVM